MDVTSPLTIIRELIGRLPERDRRQLAVELARSATASDPLLTLDEVCAITRAPKSSVYSWIYSRKLESRKIGRHRLVLASSLARFIEQGEAVPS